MLATILHQMQLKKGFMESCVLALQYGKHERKEQQAQIETKLSMLLGISMLQQDFQLLKKENNQKNNSSLPVKTFVLHWETKTKEDYDGLGLTRKQKKTKDATGKLWTWWWQ
jgi:hypothetical protein